MWEWLGEPLAVDFANTRKRRGPVDVDLLADGHDLLGWLAAERRIAAGRVPAVPARLAGERLGDVRAVRDDVAALLRGAVSGGLPSSPRQRVNALVARLPVVAELGADGALRTQVLGAADRVDELIGLVAVAAVSQAADPAGLAFCDAPSCGQFFLRPRPDARWCSPACGTRFRVAQHAARHRPDGAG
jgi:predicted RNA-binding Zn ribbon-like protein